MARMGSWLVLVWAVALGVAGAQSSYTPAAEKQEAVFSTLRQEWATNLWQKRVDASIAEYAPDAVFVQPDGTEVRGAEAIGKLFAQVTAAFDSDLVFAGSRVDAAADRATDTGRYREVMTGRAGGKRTLVAGEYTTEYRRAADGRWLIARQKWTMTGQPIALNLAPHAVVALTFDDLPAAGTLPQGETRAGVLMGLSAELKTLGMEGTYGFVNGVKVWQNADTEQALRVWLDAGMNIGSHTWSHPPLSSTAADAYIDNIARNEPVLAQYGEMRDWKWFRYPFLWEGETLEKRHAVRTYLKEHGYRVAQVTLDFEDYAWNSAYGRCSAVHNAEGLQWLHDSYLQTADEYIRLGREEQLIAFGHEIPNVLLLHATAFTTRMLPELVSQLKGEGFTFAPLAEIERDPVYSEDPDAALKYGGTLPDQFMDSRHLPYPPIAPKPFDRLESICR